MLMIKSAGALKLVVIKRLTEIWEGKRLFG